jgi:hypothetical protein
VNWLGAGSIVGADEASGDALGFVFGAEAHRLGDRLIGIHRFERRDAPADVEIVEI